MEQVVGNLASIDGRIAIILCVCTGPRLGRVQHLRPGFEPARRYAKEKREEKRDRLPFDGAEPLALMVMPEQGCRGASCWELAGIDGRIAIFFVFAPVLGWAAQHKYGNSVWPNSTICKSRTPRESKRERESYIIRNLFC